MGDLDKLNRHAKPRLVAPDAALQHVLHGHFASDLRDVLVTILVSNGGQAADDGEMFWIETRQLRSDFFRDAVAEIILLRIATQIVERNDDDRSLFGPD